MNPTHDLYKNHDYTGFNGSASTRTFQLSGFLAVLSFVKLAGSGVGTLFEHMTATWAALLHLLGPALRLSTVAGQQAYQQLSTAPRLQRPQWSLEWWLLNLNTTIVNLRHYFAY
jgi:hypothetical protein